MSPRLDHTLGHRSDRLDRDQMRSLVGRGRARVSLVRQPLWLRGGAPFGRAGNQYAAWRGRAIINAERAAQIYGPCSTGQHNRLEIINQFSYLKLEILKMHSFI